MSSTIDNIDCPECGGCALLEHDNKTQENHTHCTEPGCDYDSNDEFNEDENIDLNLEFDPDFDFDDNEDDDDENYYYDDRNFDG